MSNDENLLFSQPHLTKVNIMQVLTLDEIQQVSGAACNWRDFSKNTIGSALGGAAGGAIVGLFAGGIGAIPGAKFGAIGGAITGSVQYGSTCWW
ncbi:TPA: Blp family class II bacteriocin [Neisseria gonorrhoeae]